MKVYIGPYTSWFGPYQLAQKILFWKDKDKFIPDNMDELHPDTIAIDKLGDRLDKIKWLSKFLRWIDSKKKRRIYIKIDGYDSWSTDHTLAMIIHPLLIKLKDNKYGSPLVDDEDVPEHLKSTSAPPLTQEEKDRGYPDDNHHDRWAWVMDEMIWTFEQYTLEDWEDQYYSGSHDMIINDGHITFGPNDTFKVDHEGLEKHSTRMANGRRLFAKYYESLWT